MTTFLYAVLAYVVAMAIIVVMGTPVGWWLQ